MKVDLKSLDSTLQRSWSKETCYPLDQKDWTPENPAFGQCAITALIVQDYFDGELLYCKRYYHYWNRLPDNREIDLSHSQFPQGVTRNIDEIRSREYVLESDSAKKAATLERYKILKQRVHNFLDQEKQKEVILSEK